jgi:hypothetical protein
MLARGMVLAQGSGLIHYRCTASTHQQGVEGRTADTLTVHEGKWSYCPKDIREKDHVWQPTGGIRIELLRRGSPTINLDLDVRPHVGTKPASTPAGPSSPSVSNGGTPRKRATKR